MKQITVIAILLLFVLVSGYASQPSEEDFIKFSGDFYAQMFTDGEQSTKVKKLYVELIDEYSAFKNHALFVNLDGMYEALGNDGVDATQYQLEVMRILNE